MSDTGTGKSLVAISLIRYHQRVGNCKRALVLVPRQANKAEWSREVAKHSDTARCIILAGSSNSKWGQLEEDDYDIAVETYAGFLRLCCVKQQGRGKGKYVPSIDRIKALANLVQALVLDESTAVANWNSLTFKVASQLKRFIGPLYIMTGTPFGRDPSLLWAQLNLVDDGYTLGSTLGMFRSVFFSTRVAPWGAYEHTFLKRKQSMLHRFLAHCTIRYPIDTADLPEVVRIRKTVKLAKSAEEHYKQARDIINAGRTGNADTMEIRQAFLRMRQISSGFLGFKDDETGERAQFEFPQNPKMEMLLGLLENLRYKAIVFHEFNHSGEAIAKELRKLEIGHVQLYGKNSHDSANVLRRFDQDPDCEILVLSNALAIGLNLQIARYGFFYESPVSVINRTQAMRRIERQGSKHDRIFIYDLVTAGTMDERILEFHEEGKDLFKAICDGKVKI
jgi:SNF2 family DNA or RNA helicase